MKTASVSEKNPTLKVSSDMPSNTVDHILKNPNTIKSLKFLFMLQIYLQTEYSQTKYV